MNMRLLEEWSYEAMIETQAPGAMAIFEKIIASQQAATPKSKPPIKKMVRPADVDTLIDKFRPARRKKFRTFHVGNPNRKSISDFRSPAVTT